MSSNQRLWKMLTLRDFKFYLISEPLPNREVEGPLSPSEIKIVEESEEEAKTDGQNPFTESLAVEELRTFENNIHHLSDWSVFYKNCKSNLDLNGDWIGDYDAHGFEHLKIYHYGYKVRAIKVTGDPNVPAKKVTWEMTLDSDLKKGKGRVHLANDGFVNSRWSTGYIQIESHDQIIFSWYFEVVPSFWIKMSAGVHRKGTMPFMSRKLQNVDFGE